jgi:hypothetical protein
MTAGSYHGFDFWVYDVCQGLVFAEMAAAAEAIPRDERPGWMIEIIPELKLYAGVNDFHIPLDEWADGHEEEFIDLVAKAKERLIARGTVTPEEAAEWFVMPDLPIHWRGKTPITTESAVEFADAMIQIVRGTYPAAPAGHNWYFGAHTATGEVATVANGL